MPKKNSNSHFIPFIQNIKLHICLWKICPLSPLRCGKLNQTERGHPSVKGKSVPLQAWSGPEGSRKLRFPDFVTMAQDGGRLSELHTGCLYPQEIQLVLISVTGILNEFLLDGTEIEVINYYTFLGSIIARDGYDYKEINIRLSIGGMAMTKLEKNMKDRDIIFKILKHSLLINSVM